jgi:hypothetical protein
MRSLKGVRSAPEGRGREEGGIEEEDGGERGADKGEEK